MKIAIIGTRGIPNNYGGFEQFSEHLSVELVRRGHEVAVFNSDNHPYKEKDYKGVQIIHARDPEDKLGTFGQFIYDRNCIRICRKSDFDIILQLGYTSSSIWSHRLPRKKSKVVTNMDGLEWKRSKFSKPVQRFLRFAEKLAVKNSDLLVADSIGIQEYLQKKYNVESKFIPYGADEIKSCNDQHINDLGLEKNGFFLIIARLEPENNIKTIINGVLSSSCKTPIIVIGKKTTVHAKQLISEYVSREQVQFLGGIYNKEILDALRMNCKLYFHGHSVGGTNPSLLEAMACSSLICAHKNAFNQHVLENDGCYFGNAEDVKTIVDDIDASVNEEWRANNLEKIRTIYSWNSVINAYENAFQEALTK